MDSNNFIIENVDNVDITEPAAMDMLLVRFEEIDHENEEYMELLLTRLDDIVITWPRPWYQQTRSLTRPIKVDEDADNNNETYRTDSFTQAETEIVQKNWKRFREEFELPDKPICLARWRNKNCKHPKARLERIRHFVISYLARGLERYPYQVYKHFVTEYGAPVKGPYSAHEEKIMDICFHHCPSKAVVYLSAILGREPRNIYTRLHLMLNGKPELKSRKRTKWSLQLATEFLEKLMKHSGYSLKELKNTKFNLSVWLELQEDMDQPYDYLRKFWYRQLHVLLFVEYDVKYKKLRKKLMKILKSTPVYKVWTDIRWKDVARKFPDGFTSEFLRGVAYRLIRSHQIPNKWLKDPLIDVVNYTLLHMKNSPTKRRRLKTLTLSSEGNLEVIKHNVKMDFPSIN